MEELALESNAFFMGIEYLAVFCSGLMGGLCAVRKNYDLFAMLITAWLTALGGGIIRDVMLGSLPPVGISDRGFVLTALVSGLAIAVIHPEVDKLRWSMLTIDALAVGLFAVNGTSKALDLGTSGMTAVFMGMFTALGGGTLRDRKGRDFTVTCSAPGGAGVRTVFNPVPLYMGERLREMPVDVAVAAFTTETPARVSQILDLLFNAQPFDSEFTRGLYYTNN